MTLEQLQSYIPRLKDRLSLQSWNITVRWSERGDRFTNGEMGEVKWAAELETATIVLSKRNPKDHLHTLVHEMLHIFFEGQSSKLAFVAEGMEERYELKLNKLATLLVNGCERLL